MDELISKQAALEALADTPRYPIAEEVLQAAHEIINALPEVDAVPVVHGRWGEYETNPLAYSLSGFPCSVCGMHQDDIRGLYYCPNCGARMGGEAE